MTKNNFELMKENFISKGGRGNKKPTAIKKLEGSYYDEEAAELEPQPDVGLPSTPKHLSAVAKERWEYLGLILSKLGVMTEIDEDIFSMYCEAYATMVQAKKKVQAIGKIIKTTNGNLVHNPWLNVYNKACEDMLKLGKEFGLSPASRTRISIDSQAKAGKKTTANDWEGLLN